MLASLESRSNWFSKKRSWFIEIQWPLNFGDARLDNPRFGKVELPAFWVGGTIIVGWKPVNGELAGSHDMPTSELVKPIFDKAARINKLVFVDESGTTTSFTNPLNPVC